MAVKKKSGMLRSKVSSKRKSTGRRSPEEKRKSIVDAATLLFARSGYDGVTFREIALHANIPLATIHHYFPRKEALYDVSVTESFEFTAKRFVHAMQVQGDVRKQVLALFQVLIDLLLSQNPEVKLIDRALLDEHHAKYSANRSYDAIKRVVKQRFESLAARSHINASWMEISELFIGLVYGVVKFRPLHAQMLTGSIPSGPGRLAELMTEFFLAGIGGDRSA
jgi:AcrR family transcriptional regulator